LPPPTNAARFGIAPHSKAVASDPDISKYYSARVRANDTRELRIALKKKTSRSGKLACLRMDRKSRMTKREARR
jgi:hypothetical protein